jgi:hypothetical protein
LKDSNSSYHINNLSTGNKRDPFLSKINNTRKAHIGQSLSLTPFLNALNQSVLASNAFEKVLLEKEIASVRP